MDISSLPGIGAQQRGSRDHEQLLIFLLPSRPPHWCPQLEWQLHDWFSFPCQGQRDEELKDLSRLGAEGLQRLSLLPETNMLIFPSLKMIQDAYKSLEKHSPFLQSKAHLPSAPSLPVPRLLLFCGGQSQRAES